MGGAMTGGGAETRSPAPTRVPAWGPFIEKSEKSDWSAIALGTPNQPAITTATTTPTDRANNLLGLRGTFCLLFPVYAKAT